MSNFQKSFMSCFTLLASSCCFDLQPSHIFCARPSATNETFAGNVVSADRGDRVELRCQRCRTEEHSPSPRLWYRHDVAERGPWLEVQLGMDAPLTANRVFVTAEHSLVIQSYQPEQDAGRYWCRGLEGDDPVFTITYLLEDLVPLNASEPYVLANTTWFESLLAPLAEALDQLAGEESPDVSMHWSRWGPCEDCETTGLGQRARRGRCVAVTPAHLHLLPYNLTSVSCRSRLLQQLNVSTSVRDQLVSVPDQVVYEKCECDRAETTAQLQHKLREGDDLHLVCPGASGHEAVQWKRGLDVLSLGLWLPQGKAGRLRVDTLGTLHVQHAETSVAGHYTCRAAGKTWRFLVEVEQQFVLTSQEMQRDVRYVLAMLGICLALYLAYLGLLCCEAPTVRHLIMFGTPAAKGPLDSESSSSPRDLELNLMESGSQVSGCEEEPLLPKPCLRVQ